MEKIKFLPAGQRNLASYLCHELSVQEKDIHEVSINYIRWIVQKVINKYRNYLYKFILNDNTDLYLYRPCTVSWSMLDILLNEHCDRHQFQCVDNITIQKLNVENHSFLLETFVIFLDDMIDLETEAQEQISNLLIAEFHHFFDGIWMYKPLPYWKDEVDRYLKELE